MIMWLEAVWIAVLDWLSPKAIQVWWESLGPTASTVLVGYDIDW